MLGREQEFFDSSISKSKTSMKLEIIKEEYKKNIDRYRQLNARTKFININPIPWSWVDEITITQQLIQQPMQRKKYMLTKTHFN